MNKFYENIGIYTLNIISELWQILLLFGQTLYWIFIGPFKKKNIPVDSVLYQMVFMGIQSLIIVFFVMLFTGIVLAMQGAPQLAKFGAVMYISSFVGVSIVRELGPVLTALVIAGRIGAAITAEIGSMKVNEQIEALSVMAINPVRFLVVPRFLSLIIMLPCLTLLGNIIGMIGGFLIGITNLNINPYLYIDITIKFLTLKDIYTGIFKSFIFSILIVLVACYKGLTTEGGAEGVGRATTVSVVTSFILIILADCILTGIFYFAKI
ncbi:MAG: ABC transporter permease [Candidatus Omnitrophota bacterium]